MSKSSSKTESWKLIDFGSANDVNSDFDSFIELPKFQRSLVWNEKQQLTLIDSIYRGFPIGALLTYQSETKNNKIYLEMVDGLQRMTAILEYTKRPLYFAPVDCIFSESFIDSVCGILHEEINDDTRNQTNTLLQKWLQQTELPKAARGWNFTNFKNYISVGNSDISTTLDELLDTFNTEIDTASALITSIGVTQIPVIKYQGAIDNIPTIFERINNQGTKLSKYEIFASSWLKSATLIKSPEIHKAIRDKYNVHIENNYEISGYDPAKPIDEDKYNLYEYLFGLGKVLSNQFPLLFESNSEPDDVTPIAFVLCTIALGLPTSEMRSLHVQMPRKNADLINPTAMEKAIRDSVKQIDNKLKPFLKVKLNSTTDKRHLPHSQNQIISLISAYLVNEYDSEWRPTNSADAKKILDNAPSHYLYDIIRNNWRGSGDSRLFHMTWEEDKKTPSQYYSEKIEASQFRDALNSWFEDSLKKNQKERSSISGSVRAVLLFLYSQLITVFDDANDLYELEHIYPVGHISEIIGSGTGWPISALGNLMLLPQPINRIKGKDLLGDVLPGLIASGAVTDAEEKKITKYLLYPKDWNLITSSPKIDRERFIAFCTSRHETIADMLIDALNL